MAELNKEEKWWMWWTVVVSVATLVSVALGVWAGYMIWGR